MDFYNGYSPQERNRKLRASYKAFPNRSHPLYSGPCQLCGNPACNVEPHTEDYSEPYLWTNPAEYGVCKTCHSRLHKRFRSPHAWLAYKAHVRRGGYGADLKTSARVCREVLEYARANALGISMILAPLRDRAFSGREWWEVLSLDPRTLTDSTARPRS
jgi:hypothetical protein